MRVVPCLTECNIDSLIGGKIERFTILGKPLPYHIHLGLIVNVKFCRGCKVILLNQENVEPKYENLKEIKTFIKMLSCIQSSSNAKDSQCLWLNA